MTKILAQALQIPWGSSGTKTVQGPLASSITFGSIISNNLKYIFYFGGVGLLIMLLGSGFTFLTSAGDPKKMEKAKGQLTNALIGFLLIFVAFWLVQAAGIIFGIAEFGQIFPSQ
jgi:hypothetical protein